MATDHVDRTALRGPIGTSCGVLVRGAAAASATSGTSSPAATAAARTGATAPWTAGVAIRTHASIPEAAAECSLGNARFAVTARRADIAASITAGGPTAAGLRGRRAAAPIPQEHDDSDRHEGQRPPIAKHPNGSHSPTHHAPTLVDRDVLKTRPNTQSSHGQHKLPMGRVARETLAAPYVRRSLTSSPSFVTTVQQDILEFRVRACDILEMS